MSTKLRTPNLFEALIPILFLIAFLVYNVIYFKDDTLSGANQMSLILAAAIAGIVVTRLGLDWKKILKGIVKSISSAMPSILILLLIGCLSGTWMLSGVVPAMIFYGLKILNPVVFLFAAVIVSAVVSLATGSSWSTVATLGIALLGIGNTMGIDEGVVAGAIISGAYFGDKMSPLSDTTNLAPAMAGTDLFTHIRYMMFTTIPSIVITLIIFLIWGFFLDTNSNTQEIEEVLSAIDGTFNLNPLLFLVPIALIIIIIKKVPPLPALLAGTLLGGLFAIIFQPHLIEQAAEITDNYGAASYVAVMKTMFGKNAIVTGNGVVDELLITNGMSGMLNTIWLILSAMVFGGIMESGGLLMRITKSIIQYAKSTGSLVASTVATCLFFNTTASDQYISIVVPGRMFARTYRKRGLKPEVLSRTLEDSGTVTSVLIPWNTCGATQSGVLGVSTLAYAPFAFFCIISPFMTVFFASFNIKIRKLRKDEINKFEEIDNERD